MDPSGNTPLFSLLPFYLAGSDSYAHPLLTFSSEESYILLVRTILSELTMEHYIICGVDAHDETKSSFYPLRLSKTLKFIAERVYFQSFQHQ